MNSDLDELMKSLKSKYLSSHGSPYTWIEHPVESQKEEIKSIILD